MLQALEQTIYRTYPWARGRIILLCYAGSHAYGTNTPTSDIDLRGIVIPPKDYILGLKSFDSYHSPEGGETDVVVYSLKKYISLAIQNNPNVLEMMYTDPPHIIHCNEYGERLIGIRQSFLSKRIFNTFSGYAASQLHRIVFREGKPNHGCGNPERQAIREKLHFDPKNALHLVRLMRMGYEALKYGQIQVNRPDKDYLLKIKKGDIPLEEIIKEHDDLYKEMESLKETSILPDNPDIDTIEKFLIDTLEDSLSYGEM